MNKLITITALAIIAWAFAACTPEAKRAEAEAEYANEDARCVDAVKKLPPDASATTYNVAVASFEGCLADVHARWATDGGAK